MQISEQKYINLYVNIVILDKIKIIFRFKSINLYFKNSRDKNSKDKEFYKHTLYRT